MNGSDPIDDPLARPPRVVHAGSSRSGADAIRFVLREEGIPAVVESRRDDRGSLMWATIVAQDAYDDACRALENRASLASGIDWDSFDEGEMSSRDARLLRTAPLVRHLSRTFLSVGAILILAMVGLGLVAMIAILLPSP